MISNHRATIEPGWIDYNGHLNVAYYVLLFDRALDEMLDRFGLGPAYRQQHGCSVFVGEHHVIYDREVLAEARVVIDGRILDVDGRRLVVFQDMRAEYGESGEGAAEGERDRRPVATCESLCAHVDLASRRSVPWPAPIREHLDRGRAGASNRPGRAGRAIRLRGAG
jgi:acyl-CoA thioester hydrolase